MEEESPSRVFNPHPKHDEIAAWDNASVMDLDNAIAQEVLDNALEVPGKKQLIGMRGGKIYPPRGGEAHCFSA